MRFSKAFSPIHTRAFGKASRSWKKRPNASAIENPLATSFDDGKGPYYITSPIYYVNDKPHIGHAYTSTACDVVARYMRLSGREVFFLTGTDEHGQKVEAAAKARGTNPQDWVDQNSVSFRKLLEIMNISNDQFIRTTEPNHKASVQNFWNVLVENGFIYLGYYEGWYSVRDECFYTEMELVDGKAPTGADVEWVTKEPSYFFKLSAFQAKLLDYYEKHPQCIAPESRKNEVLAFVRGGLRDLSISRTSFTWGVPVPGDSDHVMYVWIDALANYISALGYPDVSEGSKFQKFWPASLHMVGKDILRFHAVYWPAFLMAAELPLPKRLFAHGWWTKEGEKISKSLGNVIDPVELVNKYGVDQTRFFLISDGSFGNDCDFSDLAMISKVNTNLANELGNLCQRTLSMVYKNCNKAVPTKVGPYSTEDEALLNRIKALSSVTGQAIAHQALHKYTDAIIAAVWDANKYVDTMAPWVLKKTDPERMDTVLYVLLEAIRQISILYQPVIPSASSAILDQLNVPKDERTFAHLLTPIKLGASIMQPVGVFPRIEVPELIETQSR